MYEYMYDVCIHDVVCLCTVQPGGSGEPGRRPGGTADARGGRGRGRRGRAGDGGAPRRAAPEETPPSRRDEGAPFRFRRRGVSCSAVKPAVRGGRGGGGGGGV